MKKFMLVLAIILVFPLFVFAASTELSWDINSDASEYQIFQSEIPGDYNYEDPAWRGNGDSAMISGMADNTTYYFVIKAYNSCGNSSEPSIEISYTTPPPCGIIEAPVGATATTILIIK